MTRTTDKTIDEILTNFRLAALPCKADLRLLARRWGVISIEEQEIHSDAMLLPIEEGYRIILKKADQVASLGRQRFSLAHELGHLLLQKSETTGIGLKYRGHGFSDEEERLCDQIAAEILMPRMAFYEDCWMEDWSLKGLRRLANKYETSLEATAIRMVDLMPEEALMGIWKISTDKSGNIEQKWSHRGGTRYALPATAITPNKKLELIRQSHLASGVLEGVAPVKLGDERAIDVPAEAMSYGSGENQKVMVFYYPTRHPSSPV